MFDIFFGKHNRRCDGVSRRDFLRVGALGAVGLGLSGWLRARASVPAGNAVAPRAQSVILIYLGGGMSHHDTFDPKPGAPAEVRGVYQSISTNVPGVQISEKLPLMAQSMHRVALVRSGAHNNDHHETATNWALCGRFGSPFGDYPAMGAVVSHQLGFRGSLPPYVAIPRNPSFTWELGKSAWLGGRYESFATGDPNAANFQVRDVALPGTVTPASLARRQTLLHAIDSLAEEIEGNDQIATYSEFQQRAASIVLSPEARSAFDIEQEPVPLRDRYGRTTFGQSVLLARRLIERDVRFATVNFGGWDHHANIFNSLNNKLPDFDRGLSALLADLDDRGLLATTLVAVFGEFGRSPLINRDTGRDHWGPAASLLFAGAGVRGGQVIGQTDNQGGHVTRRPVAPADVACTIYDAVGVDPHGWLSHPEGRPVEILDTGEPVSELYQ